MPKPKGEIIGTIFFSTILFIISVLILFGLPTKPSSSDSGTTSIILLFFVFIDIASVPFFLSELTIYKPQDLKDSQYSIFINKISILVGDFMFSKALSNMITLKSFDALEILSTTAERLSQGEILQIEKALKREMTEEIYFQICFL